MHHTERHDAVATKVYADEPKICGSLLHNVLHITLLELRILRWFYLDFWKIYATLV